MPFAERCSLAYFFILFYLVNFQLGRTSQSRGLKQKGLLRFLERRQFVNLFLFLFYLFKTNKQTKNISCPNGKKRDLSNQHTTFYRQTDRSFHFRFRFGKQAGKKGFQLICLRFTIISYPNSRVVENGQMFWEYKQRQKLECSPYALS